MVTTVPMKPKLFSRVQPTNTLLSCSISFFKSNIKDLSSSNSLGWQLWLLTWDCGHLRTKSHMLLYTLPLRCSFSLQLFSWTRIVYSQLHLLQQQRQKSAVLLDTCVTWFLPSRPIAQYSNLNFQHDCYITPCLCLRLFCGQTIVHFCWRTVYISNSLCIGVADDVLTCHKLLFQKA